MTFFSRESQPGERPLDAGTARRCAGALHQHRRELGDRRIGHLVDDRREHFRQRAVYRRHVATAARSRLERLRFAVQPQDSVHGRTTDSEQLRRLLVRVALGAKAKNCLAQFQRGDHIQ